MVTRTIDRLINEALRDAAHGWRRWRNRPLFAAAAVATIALATGAATALFSMVDGVLLKPLPYPGARAEQVTRLFLGEAARLAAIGGGIGLLGAAGAAYVSRSLLHGVGTLDGWTFAIVAGGAIAIALSGGYFPARRASRLDPVIVLRAD
jgi:hypothetical protein